jgi:hypothetical protein
MTTPGGDGNFEYTDDSVIARVSVDVPSQALTDLNQLAEAMAAMRTQLSAVADAQEKWLEFLNQMPKVTQDTNDAIKDQITLLERQTYLQGELGGGRGGGQGASAGGGGSYSTAAPAGYAPPWAPGTPGTGATPPAPEQIAEKYQRIQAENPGLDANVQSAHGAVNPALLSVVGAAAAAVDRKMGRGEGRAGNSSPQPTGAERDSSAAPDQGQGGAPSTAGDPNTPGDPSPDDTDAAKKDTLLTQLVNDFKGGKGGRARRMASTLLGSASNSLSNPSSGGGIIGQIMGSTAGKAAGAVGLGALAYNKIQDLGEKYTEYQGLGSVQGGDAMTGMKYEAQARIMGLNPFITTQQAREAMQKALKEGFRGENYDTVLDFMTGNFKELGISMGQSMDLMKASVKGLNEGDSQAGTKSDLDKTLNTMKEMSAEGGLSFPERVNQLQDMKEEMSAQGFSSEAINRAALGTQEGLGDSLALRESGGRITSQTTGSNMLMTLAAQKAGITGMLPNALPAALEAAGMDPDEIRDSAASQVAGYVSGYAEMGNRIAAFQMLMGQYGVELTWPEAEALYGKVSKGQGSLPSKQANSKVARQGQTQTAAGSAGRTSNSPADSDWTKNHPNYTPSENAAGESQNFEAAGRGGGNFSPSGNAPAAMPTTGQPVPSFSSNGTVSGTVTITVDQAGRVTAPPTIQLTGQQKAALAGYSSAQLNNAPPGDPTYNHSYNAFPAAAGSDG